MIIDIHTHHSIPNPESVVSLNVAEMEDFFPLPGQLYSLGLHPWSVGCNVEAAFNLLEKYAENRQVAAIGEAGIDMLRGEPLFRQINNFRFQAELAEKVGKPLIIHCVKAHDIIVGIKNRMTPSCPWIIHGFRGKPSVAKILLGSGCYLSFGQHFNPDTVRMADLSRMLAETDADNVDIEDVVGRLSEAAGCDVRQYVVANATAIFGDL